MGFLSAWFEYFIFGGTVQITGAKTGGPVVITVIGSGGKTSLIWHLARCLRQGPDRSVRKILVTPGAKMALRQPDAQFDRFCEGAPAAIFNGVTLAGISNEKTGKLDALASSDFERITGNYDLVLVEGDGSRGLPLKGWADNEPVVPAVTGITVGVISLGPLGMAASAELIHRLPLFCALTGAEPGEPLGLAHFAAAISGSTKDGTAAKNLFSAARGKKVLFINQIEDDAACSRARELVSLLRPGFRLTLSAILAGSVRRNTVLPLKGV